jgi:hypothetical protein
VSVKREAYFPLGDTLNRVFPFGKLHIKPLTTNLLDYANLLALQELVWNIVVKVSCGHG